MYIHYLCTRNFLLHLLYLQLSMTTCMYTYSSSSSRKRVEWEFFSRYYLYATYIHNIFMNGLEDTWNILLAYLPAHLPVLTILIVIYDEANNTSFIVYKKKSNILHKIPSRTLDSGRRKKIFWMRFSLIFFYWCWCSLDNSWFFFVIIERATDNAFKLIQFVCMGTRMNGQYIVSHGRKW